jgi:hypothetical protein
MLSNKYFNNKKKVSDFLQCEWTLKGSQKNEIYTTNFSSSLLSTNGSIRFNGPPGSAIDVFFIQKKNASSINSKIIKVFRVHEGKCMKFNGKGFTSISLAAVNSPGYTPITDVNRAIGEFTITACYYL